MVAPQDGEADEAGRHAERARRVEQLPLGLDAQGPTGDEVVGEPDGSRVSRGQSTVQSA